MECSETGKHEVVRLSHVSLSLAQDLDRAIASVHIFNGGHGIISLHLKAGEVPDVDVTMRHFRKTRLIKLNKAS